MGGNVPQITLSSFHLGKELTSDHVNALITTLQEGYIPSAAFSYGDEKTDCVRFDNDNGFHSMSYQLKKMAQINDVVVRTVSYPSFSFFSVVFDPGIYGTHQEYDYLPLRMLDNEACRQGKTVIPTVRVSAVNGADIPSHVSRMLSITVSNNAIDYTSTTAEFLVLPRSSVSIQVGRWWI